ncbi:hypothetical protein [Lichenibacterium ramalinae]|nr:hypothetical protein [Lichenibacterium ramalinae]
MILAALAAVHASPALLAMGFSILLVVSLVAAEEAERRTDDRPEERGV